MVRFSTIDELEREPNLPELLAAYAAESAIAGMPGYHAQMDSYRQLETAGLLHAFASYDGLNLAGLLLLMLAPLPHYGGAIIATTESFFVAPESRHAGHGIRLLRAAETHARTLGAVGLFVSAPKGGRLAQVLDGMESFSEASRVFFKGLRDA